MITQGIACRILVFRDVAVGELRIEAAVPLSKAFKPSLLQTKANEPGSTNVSGEGSGEFKVALSE